MHEQQSLKKKDVDMKDIDYITREFVRHDCGVHGAIFSDENCDIVIAEVARLAEEGMFSHTGVYWIVNRLAAEGRISPKFPPNCMREKGSGICLEKKGRLYHTQ